MIRSFGSIFAPELHGRLRWFVKLRWLAVCGLCAAAFAGPAMGFQGTWPSLFVVAFFVALYNLLFWARLRQPGRPEAPLTEMRTLAIAQMALDLGALLVTVNFTGGMESPVLAFVAFHMAIGTIMIATRIMWLIAAGTCVAAAVLYGFEEVGLLGSWASAPGHGGSTVSLLAFVVLVFGMVYLTDSVTSRFKRRSIERYAAIDKLKERTAQLQSSLSERETLQKQKDHYMRISTHQLRSPLGTIKTSLQVLLGGYMDLGSEAGKHLLEGVAERVDDLLAIVNDLLELTKMREGQEKAPWAHKVFLNQVLADIFDALEPLAQEREVELVPDIDGVAELDWGVPPDLVYAFENIIHNAIKYSHRGGRVTISLRVSGSTAIVVVADEGIGVPLELQTEIFFEFVRAPNAKQHASEGTGLGLTIVSEAIKLHGGEIRVESVEGEGSRFITVLPLDFLPADAPRK